MVRSLLVAAIAGSIVSIAVAGSNELMSISSEGVQSNRTSVEGVLSADGRFVAFASESTNLAPGAWENTVWDIFVRDRIAGTTVLASVRSNGASAVGGSSYNADISRDGRYVVFDSRATNLVGGDTNGTQDIFVHDLHTGQTTCVSRNADGVLGDGASESPRVSADGRYVMFTSAATNLVEGDANGKSDVFVVDRDTGAVTMASVDNDGSQSARHCVGEGFSADGRFAMFRATTGDFGSPATGHALFARDLVDNVTIRVSPASFEGFDFFNVENGEISDDGRFAVYTAPRFIFLPGVTDYSYQVFLTDLTTGETTYVSRGNPAEQPTHAATRPYISGDGNWVTFISNSPHLVEGSGVNGHVFLYDRVQDEMSIASVGSTGGPDDWYAGGGRLSPDGRYIAINSSSVHFFPGDENDRGDVILVDRGLLGCPGDINGDEFIDFEDLNILLSTFNVGPGEPGHNGAADVNGDGLINFADLNIVLSTYHQPC